MWMWGLVALAIVALGAIAVIVAFMPDALP